LYLSSNIIRVNKSRRLRKMVGVHLTGNTIGKRQLGRVRRILGDNIRMDLKWVSVRGIGLIRFKIYIIRVSL
jgi:hypothetical protein